MTRTTEAAILSSASLSAGAMYRMTIDVVSLLKNGAQDLASLQEPVTNHKIISK